MKKPLKKGEQAIHATLLIALYQLVHLTNIPEHAVVSSAVDTARQLKKEWACGLINAVLRNAIRNHSSLLDQVNALPECRFECPSWLLHALQTAWPDHWQSTLEASQQHPPLVLRVNTSKVTRTTYLSHLQEAGIEAKVLPHAPDAVMLNKAESVKLIPGFSEGWVSVQDSGAQLAADLLEIAPGMRVLDACSAPGGKTCHLLERCPELNVVALDCDEGRLKKVKENLERIGLTAQTVCADATAPDTWWDGTLFDRILIDAPCSGTGVMRRNPDIRWLRTPQQIKQLTTTQKRLLDRLWPLVKPGGFLLYITCSILPDENEALLEKWIQSTNDAQPCTLSLEGVIPQKIGAWLLPGNLDQTDGFYFAKLCKQ
jgi:16S rRNA (cytosine967-C5)-methyltransferase